MMDGYRVVGLYYREVVFFMLEKKVSGVTAVEVKGYPVLSFDSEVTGEYMTFSGCEAKKVFIDFLLSASLYRPSILKHYNLASLEYAAVDLPERTLKLLLTEAGSIDTLLKILQDVDVPFIETAFEHYDSDLAYQLLADVVSCNVYYYESFESLLESEFNLWGAEYELLKESVDWDDFCFNKGIHHCDDYYFIW